MLAPVLNMSGSRAFDPLRMTDLLASELASFAHVQVVPLNRTLAELSAMGKSEVASVEDALALGRATGADLAVVVAVTEFEPYYPPVIGLIGQVYSLGGGGADAARVEQEQRVFNAADEKVAENIQAYASNRDADDSPYGWRRYVRSQELYVRYCGWSLFETMELLNAGGLEAAEPHGAQS